MLDARHASSRNTHSKSAPAPTTFVQPGFCPLFDCQDIKKRGLRRAKAYYQENTS
jgi:hypothetical protein